MKRIRPLTLIAWGVCGFAFGFLADLVATKAGMPTIIPPLSLGITLLFVALVVFAVSLPIRRVTRGHAGPIRDPFWAARVVVFAQACAIAGAVLAGVTGGILAFVFWRAAPVETSTLIPTIFAFGASVALLVAGLLAEFFCVLPPDDHDHDAGDPS